MMQCKVVSFIARLLPKDAAFLLYIRKPTRCKSSQHFFAFADVMYIEAAIPDLIETLVAAATRSTVILVSHGRNRQAEGAFLHCCKGKFDLAQIDSSQLDEVYQTGDVDVLLLQSVQTQTSGKHVLKVPAD